MRDWRVRDWRVRTKLAVVLLVPLLALLLVAGWQIRALVDQDAVLDDFAQQQRLGQQVAALVHELQGERDRTVGELAAFEKAGRAAEPGDLSTAVRRQRTAVDTAVAGLRRAGAAVDGGRVWRTAYERATNRLENLASARAGVRTGTLPRRAAQEVYGRTIDAVLALLSAPAPGPEQIELDRLRAGNVELARTKELGAQLRSRIHAVTAAGEFAPGDYVEIANLRTQRLAALARFRAVAPPAQVDRYDIGLAGPVQELASQLEQAVIDSGGRPGLELDPASWWKAATDQLNLVRGVESELLADAADRAAQRSEQQQRRTWLVIGAIGVAILAGLVISLLIGRSMARALRLLRRDALQVAHFELPQVLERLSDVRGRVPDLDLHPPTARPAGVRAGDEIGEVADAFAAVHASAVSLAMAQAVMRRNVNAMFVNLARRSQVLVERQLEVLDELEREEDDPELLHGLFRLDHLATRMRRNDESLLVLAGNDNARRWSAPIPISEAVLAAVAEIEQYQRVRHGADNSRHIVGHAIADVVHLLAELLENATTFSRPDTLVRIVGTVVGDQVQIEIIDAGIGMSSRAIDEANVLLASPPAPDVAASERMGLFVVGHLAARHGVRVRLRPAGVRDDADRPDERSGWVAGRPADPSSTGGEPLDGGASSDDGRPAPGRHADVGSARGMVASVWLPPSLLAEPTPMDLGTPPGRIERAVNGQVGAAPRAIAPPEPARPDGPPRTTQPARGLAAVGYGVADAGLPPMPPMTLTFTGRRGTPTPAGMQPGRAIGRGTVGRAHRADGTDGTGWWSRAGTGGPPIARTSTTAPPEVPVTAGLTEHGLPVRVPMAQLPAEDAAPSRETGPRVPAPRAEPDPDAVGSTLSRFYGGVRRAEAEEDGADHTAVSVGTRQEEQQ